MANTWQDIAARKQRERNDRVPKAWLLPTEHTPSKGTVNVLDIPQRCGILSHDELAITESTATDLIRKLTSGQLKSVDVTTAFCKRAAIAQQVTNCLTEIFFDDAIARAKQLDAEYAKTGRPVGPLHGLPISLKDSFKVKGYDASVGVAAFCFKPATANSALVDLLLQLGAVLYCKTNVPLTMAALDSHNNVFGRTLNPCNLVLTPGGSSGGEGALVAMKGSPIGIGTDVGGSIRIPAMCNGLAGVKPSHGRVPFAGQEGGALPGSNKIGIEATAGPIARNFEDCGMLMRAISDGTPWTYDPDVIPQGWTMQESAVIDATQPLRIGIVRTEGHVTPLPPIQRLMDEVARTLSRSQQRPIDVIEVDISNFGPRLLKVFNGMMSIDGANTWFDHMEKTGEPISPWLSTRLKRRSQKSLGDVRQLQAQKTELQTLFQDVWRESGGYWQTSTSETKGGGRVLDAIVCPVAPHPVPPIDRWNTTNYTSAFNLLDVPAGTLPIRALTQQDLQGDLPASAPLNGWDKINRGLWDDVDRKVYVGSPLCVQVLTPKLMDRKLVEVMGVLEKALMRLSGRVERGSKL